MVGFCTDARRIEIVANRIVRLVGASVVRGIAHVGTVIAHPV